jgi:hypothetical protein
MRYFLLATISFAFLAFCNFASAQGAFGYSNETGFSGGFGYGYVSIPRYTAPAKYDPRLDPALIRAAKIADQRSGNHSTARCWHSVKDALVDAGAVRSRPTTAYASEAGDELMKQDGFVRLRISDPYRAPIGAVIVYSGHGAGHVEIRTANGFASDYHSRFACRFHMIGVYAKLHS